MSIFIILRQPFAVWAKISLILIILNNDRIIFYRLTIYWPLTMKFMKFKFTYFRWNKNIYSIVQKWNNFRAKYFELVSSAETRAPKWHNYISAEILPEGRKPERRNDDSAEKFITIPLQWAVYYPKQFIAEFDIISQCLRNKMCNEQW